MARITPWIVLAVLMGLAGCDPKYIEGTKIEDSDEAREVVRTVEMYRKAMESRDSDMLIALASKHYFEKNGDSNSRNNYDYDGLVNFLRSPEFRQVTAVRMKIVYRSLVFNDEHTVVTVRYHHSSDFKLPPAKYKVDEKAATGDGEDNFDEEVWYSKTDDNEMVLQLEEGKWYILKGM